MAVLSDYADTVAFLVPSEGLRLSARRVRLASITVCAFGTATILVNLDTAQYVPSLFAYAILLLVLLIVEGRVLIGVCGSLLLLGASTAQIALIGAGLNEYVSVAYLTDRPPARAGLDSLCAAADQARQ